MSWRRVQAWIRILFRWVVRTFTHSLQVRVVSVTIVFTIVAIYGVGAYLSQQIARGLFESKQSDVSATTNGYVAELEALSGLSDSQEAADALNAQLRSMLSRSSLQLQSIALEPVGNSKVPPLVAITTGYEPISVSDISPELRESIRESPAGYQKFQSVQLEGTEGPGLIVAQRLTVNGQGDFVLYTVADLKEEQDTLDFVQRALAVSGVVLIVLVGGVAWLVTRFVVVPVKAGSEVARKIADGDLNQRMPVSGNDEIATLAQSFNDMADNLQDQIERMERLTVLQRQFVSDVSHELRTPLTTIHIASDMIFESRDEFDESTRRSAELLNSQVERFETLLGDLLEISRHDAGAANLLAKPVDMTEIVSEVGESVSMVADQANTEILIHAPSAPVMAEADRIRISRIVNNLVVNAVEHGEENRIDVYVGSNAQAVAVSVRDHGIGMTDEQLENVFDRFWRADPSRKRTLGGSGLGLAISLEDAHLHNGWLQVWSRKGDGTCFRLTIPRRAGSTITRSPLPLPPADARVQGASIVAGPSTSDGSVRVHTGSIPIVVEEEDS